MRESEYENKEGASLEFTHDSRKFFARTAADVLAMVEVESGSAVAAFRVTGSVQHFAAGSDGKKLYVTMPRIRPSTGFSDGTCPNEGQMKLQLAKYQTLPVSGIPDDSRKNQVTNILGLGKLLGLALAMVHPFVQKPLWLELEELHLFRSDKEHQPLHRQSGGLPICGAHQAG